MRKLYTYLALHKTKQIIKTDRMEEHTHAQWLHPRELIKDDICGPQSHFIMPCMHTKHYRDDGWCSLASRVPRRAPVYARTAIPCTVSGIHMNMVFLNGRPRWHTKQYRSIVGSSACHAGRPYKRPAHNRAIHTQNMRCTELMGDTWHGGNK